MNQSNRTRRWWVKVVASVCAVNMVLDPVAVWAATFTSKATGNYNATGLTTWNEVGSPGGNAGSDTVSIGSTHTVSITAASDANADTITVNSGTTVSGEVWKYGGDEVVPKNWTGV